ncbi:MAG TPA: XdhC family protein [Bacteroidales bacterium]|nr:XdhC family protein [Bacteroidales bacterium]
MKSIYLQLPEQISSKMPVLATVVSTKGSTPQVPGSSALFNDKGLLAGTIGGGVVEKRIQDVAAKLFITGKSGYYDFNLENDISRKEEAICGGQIAILVDATPDVEVFNKVRQSLKEKEPCVLITLVSHEDDESVKIERFLADGRIKPSINEEYLKRAEPVIKEMLLLPDPSGFCRIDLTSEAGKPVFMFLEPVIPPLKLVIAGAGHIGRSLAHLGKLSGFEVTVIDDRPEYANPVNIPDASEILTGDIGKTIIELPKGKDTYIVIVTRGHKDDAEALKACIKENTAYLGMIGSRKKTVAIRDEFINKKWCNIEQWNKVHTPVGLEINARTVEEIAISIAAELIMVKNSRKDKIKGCPA